MSDLTEDPARCYRQMELLSLLKKPLWKFGYIGASYEPGCTSFLPSFGF